MAFSVEDAAEAYATICLLVVGADGVGTLPERDFLFGDLGETDVFAGHDPESLGALLGTLAGRMYTRASTAAEGMHTAGVAEICTAVGRLLNGHQRHELFSLAVRVAHSDGLVPRERIVLVEIAGHLGILPQVAETMIEGGFD